MRPRISRKESLRQSVRLSVRNPFLCVFSTIKTARDCVWSREVIGSDNRGRKGSDEEGGDKGGGE